MTTEAPVSSSRNPGTHDTHDELVEATRMSFGDHLEELRRTLIRTLIGVGIATAVCLIFGKEILGLICQPLWRIQHANGLLPQLQVLSPTAAFTAYLKIAMLAGLILSMPWVLYQFWMFVASGLYAHERRFVRLFVPTASGLFALGVLFVYSIVLPVVLQFFISFNRNFEITDLTPTALQQLLLPAPATTTAEVPSRSPLKLPLLMSNPQDPQPGDAWINETTRTLMVQTPAGLLSTPLDLGPTRSPLQSQFAIDFYVSFVLMLALGFGIAFETPIAVFFLARTGIAPVGVMRRARRYILLACVVLGAILTPPDVISQMLLAIPMYALFEIGLWWAAMAERRSAESAAGP